MLPGLKKALLIYECTNHPANHTDRKLYSVPTVRKALPLSSKNLHAFKFVLIASGLFHYFFSVGNEQETQNRKINKDKDTDTHTSYIVTVLCRQRTC